MAQYPLKFKIATAICIISLAFTPFVYAAGPNWKPTKNVELIAGAGPGGALDKTARTIQQILQDNKLLDGTATVINKPGGGGALAFSYLAQHSGNGHYLAVSPINLLTSNIIGANPLNHNDFTPIAQLFSEYSAFAVKEDSTLKSGKGWMESLRSDIKPLSIAIAPSAGSQNHIALALALKAAGSDIRKQKIVVFNTGPEAAIALLGGHVDMAVLATSNVLPHLAAGKVRVLGVSSPRRMPGTYATIPTWKEQGIDAVFVNWRGIIGPKGMPEDQIAYWDSVFAKLSRDVEWHKDLEENLWENTYMNSRDSKIFLNQQYGQLKSILTELGLAK